MISESIGNAPGGTDEGDPQAQRLERMKSEFLVAQQRRRGRASAASRPDGTDNGPLLSGPAEDTLTGVAAVRPRP